MSASTPIGNVMAKHGQQRCYGFSFNTRRRCSQRAASHQSKAQAAPAIQPAATSEGQCTPRYTRLRPKHEHEGKELAGGGEGPGGREQPAGPARKSGLHGG